MRQRKLKKELAGYTVPDFGPEGLENTLEAVKNVLHPERERMAKGQFFLDQLRFIRMGTWARKAGVAFLMIWCLFFGRTRTEGTALTLFSMTAIFLCLSGAWELGGLLRPGLLELQMTARNSLDRILLARLVLFGVFDGMVLVGIALAGSAFGWGKSWQLLLYSAAPYLAAAGGFLTILNRGTEENAFLGCAAWSCFLCGALYCLTISGWELYAESAGPVWLGAGLAGVAATVWKSAELLKKAGGNRNEINIGASV